MVVRHVIVFFVLSFFQALASHLDHRIHMSEEREKEKEEYMQGKEKERDGGGKERGNGEEKKKTTQCLTRTIFDVQSYRFRYRSWIWPGCNHQKRSDDNHLPGTFLVQNLTHKQWKEETKSTAERWKNQEHWISRVRTQIINITNVIVLFFFLSSFFRVKAKNGSWGIMVSTKWIGGAGLDYKPQSCCRKAQHTPSSARRAGIQMIKLPWNSDWLRHWLDWVDWNWIGTGGFTGHISWRGVQ